MSPGHDLPSARRSAARSAGRRPLTAADTERLLAGHEARPEAATAHHLLAGLLDSAAGPASDQELAGEVAAVAGFVLVSGGGAPRSAWFRRAGAGGVASVAGRAGAVGRRGPVIAAGIAAAMVVGLSGAAAADDGSFRFAGPRDQPWPQEPARQGQGQGQGEGQREGIAIAERAGTRQEEGEGRPARPSESLTPRYSFNSLGLRLPLIPAGVYGRGAAMIVGHFWRISPGLTHDHEPSAPARSRREKTSR